jgi:LmbE family N-acetylglucosaminyl deacetylase
MKLHNPTAEIFLPTGVSHRITHLGIGAHQDDLEFMAFHGILACYHSDELWFGGVTCTNGAGSARTGPYANFSDAEMMKVRREEQNTAATVGKYGVMIQLDYPSSAVKSPMESAFKNDLKNILIETRPEIVYTHNPADKHETHVAVVIGALQAIRELKPDQRPQKVWGCETWRDLDWLPDADKVLMDVSAHENLAAALEGIFDSQIAGGKRYDLASQGRRRANATFLESHAADKTTLQIFGMDLTPLVTNDKLDIVEYVTGFIDKFKADVTQKLSKRLGQ